MMNNNKFKVIRIRGDGNSLFRSLSYGLYKNENFHREVRCNIVQYALKHWTKFKAILDATSVTFYKNENHYASIMNADKTYGTDFEVGMFVNRYKIGIQMYKIMNDMITFIQSLDPEQEDDGNNHSYINLLFTSTPENEQEGHFEILEDIIIDHSPYRQTSSLNIDISSHVQHVSGMSQPLSERNKTKNSPAKKMQTKIIENATTSTCYRDEKKQIMNKTLCSNSDKSNAVSLINGKIPQVRLTKVNVETKMQIITPQKVNINNRISCSNKSESTHQKSNVVKPCNKKNEITQIDILWQYVGNNTSCNSNLFRQLATFCGRIMQGLVDKGWCYKNGTLLAELDKF